MRKEQHRDSDGTVGVEYTDTGVRHYFAIRTDTAGCCPWLTIYICLSQVNLLLQVEAHTARVLRGFSSLHFSQISSSKSFFLRLQTSHRTTCNRPDNSTTHTFDRHHGRDIDGACGQLAVKVVAGASGGEGCSSSGSKKEDYDIEDLVANSQGSAGSRSSSRTLRGVKGAGARKGPLRNNVSSAQEDRVNITVEGDSDDGDVGKRGGRGIVSTVAETVAALGIACLVVVAVGRIKRRG